MGWNKICLVDRNTLDQLGENRIYQLDVIGKQGQTLHFGKLVKLLCMGFVWKISISLQENSVASNVQGTFSAKLDNFFHITLLFSPQT